MKRFYEGRLSILVHEPMDSNRPLEVASESVAETDLDRGATMSRNPSIQSSAILVIGTSSS